MESNYYSIKSIKALLSENGIYLTKARGQNFLIDKNTLLKIVESAQIEQDDTVLDIGPGIGSLSHLLVDKCKKLIMIEVDNKIVQLLKKLSIGKKNVEIHHADFLKLDLEKIIGDKKVKACANIPYNITSKIIEKLIQVRHKIISFTLTMQKEVAERIVASPGTKTYGSISVFCQTFTNPTLCHIISPKVFWPQPKVESAVVRFDVVENKYDIPNEEMFFKVVKSIFTSRRKNIKNSLLGSPFISFTKETIYNALEACNIDDTVRGDTFTIDQTIELCKALDKN